MTLPSDEQLVYNFLIACATPPLRLPYFVFTKNVCLDLDQVAPFAKQISASYLDLLTSFTANPARADQQERALALFREHAPPAALDTDQSLHFSSVLAGPNNNVLRIPLLSLHSFITNLAVRDFSAARIQRALCLALSHIFCCTVDYSASVPFRVPPFPGMATTPPPFVTLTPTLPVFSGGPEEDVLVFLSRLDRLLAVYPSVTFEQKLFYLENQCKKGPLSLIQRELQYLADHPPASNAVRTSQEIYEYVKGCLMKSYTAAVDEQHYKDELQTRVKKDSETLNDYVQAILELCRKAKVRSTADKLRYMHSGLPLPLATALRSTDYTDVPTFLDVVQKLESTQRATLRAHTQHALHTGALPPYPYSQLFLPSPLAVPRPATYAQVAAAPAPAASAFPSAPQAPSPLVSSESPKKEDILDSLISKLQNIVTFQPTASAMQPEGEHSSQRAFHNNSRDSRSFSSSPPPSRRPQENNYSNQRQNFR